MDTLLEGFDPGKHPREELTGRFKRVGGGLHRNEDFPHIGIVADPTEPTGSDFKWVVVANASGKRLDGHQDGTEHGFAPNRQAAEAEARKLVRTGKIPLRPKR